MKQQIIITYLLNMAIGDVLRLFCCIGEQSIQKIRLIYLASVKKHEVLFPRPTVIGCDSFIPTGHLNAIEPLVFFYYTNKDIFSPFENIFQLKKTFIHTPIVIFNRYKKTRNTFFLPFFFIGCV